MNCDLFPAKTTTILRLSPVLAHNFKNLVKVLQLIMHHKNGKKTNLFDDAMHYEDITEDFHFPRNNPFLLFSLTWSLGSCPQHCTTWQLPLHQSPSSFQPETEHNHLWKTYCIHIQPLVLVVCVYNLRERERERLKAQDSHYPQSQPLKRISFISYLKTRL